MPAPSALIDAATEYVVLVDEQGQAIGTADKFAIHHHDTPLHLAFSCYIIDASNRLLVTQRAADKASFPGVWTNSVCGHPHPGESLPKAIRRRALTELGLTIGNPRLVLPQFRYSARMNGVAENEWCPVFVAFVGDQASLQLNPAEVAHVQWREWSKFRDAVLTGRTTVSPWCVQQVELLAQLGSDPRCWPTASPTLLPAAAQPLAR